MGADVHTIGRQSLNTTSVETLAKDISKCLKVNVEYGVYDTFGFDWDGFPREPSFEYWVFGIINHPKAKKTLWLFDEFYAYHIVWEKYGKKAFILPYFANSKWEKFELKQSINSVQYELRDNDKCIDYGTFFNDVIHNWYNCVYNRWWGFCRTFTGENTWSGEWDEIYSSEMCKFRIEAKTFFNSIGGNEAFYFNDQGKSQYLTEIYYNWPTILKEVETNFKDTTLNVSDFMTQKQFLSKDEEYPLAYYDDFADLKTE